LVCAGRALRQLPFVAEQVFEEIIAPSGRRSGPRDFEAAGDGISGRASAERALPAEALRLDATTFGIRADMRRGAGTVGFSEGMATRDQRDRFLVIHSHAGKGLANVAGRGNGVRIAVRAFRIHVDKTHLHCRQRVGEIPLSGIARIGSQPFLFSSPGNVVVGLPHVRTAAGEAEGFESHRFEGDIAGEDHKVGPGNPAAVLLLDRPEQTTCLLEVRVIRPAIEGRIALLTPAAAAAAVTCSIRAGAVPRHADEQRTVMSEIGRPPVLGVGHDRRKIPLQCPKVEALELLGVVEIRVHRVGLGGMLMQQVQRQVCRPPVLVRCTAAQGVSKWALCFSRVVHMMTPAWKMCRQYIPALPISLSIFSITVIDDINGACKSTSPSSLTSVSFIDEVATTTLCAIAR
jgi:hypothetical protein